MTHKYPKVYLVLDNCFAIKRWTTPREWSRIVKEIGFNYIEASFDNEIDMLFTSDSYKKRWFNELKEAEKEYDIKVVNFYTGYQTYRTSGLAHDDNEYVDNLIENWFKPAINLLSERENNIGFSYHALSQQDLESRESFISKERKVKQRLINIANLIGDNNITLNIEQMYAPHQTPWTIKQAKQYLNYHEKLNISIDVGHMLGQKKWQLPDVTELKKAINKKEFAHEIETFVVAPPIVKWWNKLIDKNTIVDSDLETNIINKFNEYSYYYSENFQDSDPYAWLSEVGKYSPIIHLQQTNGVVGGHKPFTKETNKTGIIEPEKVLKALKESFENNDNNYKAKPANNIYLTFEIFASNTDNPEILIKELKETLEYWREFIPNDGMYLDELI